MKETLKDCLIEVFELKVNFYAKCEKASPPLVSTRVSDEDPNNLIETDHNEVDLSCQWLKDNRMCVTGRKSKLLVVGTKSTREKK